MKNVTIKKIVFFISLSFYLLGCTSLVDKGDKLYESGLYTEAADFYQRALNKDPNNVEAKLGLDKARHKIIDRGLIEVRMLRLSSNKVGASQKLEQILRHQLEWNIQLQSAVASTQAEEIRYAKTWLLQEAERLTKASFPDEFRWFRYSYTQSLANAGINDKLDAYNSDIERKGRKRCQALAKKVSGQRFFLRSFTQKYCASWNTQVQLSNDDKDYSRYRGLTTRNRVNHSTRHNNLSQETLNARLRVLANAFEDSLWYAPNGANSLALSANGSARYQRHYEKKRRRINYTVNEVVKQKLSNGEYNSSTVEKTKYHPYITRVYEESLTINVRYESTVGSKEIIKKIFEQETNTSEAHNEEFAAAGLYPVQAEFISADSHYGSYLDQLNADYIEALAQYWRQTYCDEGIADKADESILRCAKASPDNVFVNRWTTEKFGISYQQLSELYGI